MQLFVLIESIAMYDVWECERDRICPQPNSKKKPWLLPQCAMQIFIQYYIFVYKAHTASVYSGALDNNNIYCVSKTYSVGLKVDQAPESWEISSIFWYNQLHDLLLYI